MADPKIPDDDETIRQAGGTPEEADPSTQPASLPGVPPHERMPRSAESGEGEVPGVTREELEPEEDLPSNRAQERGGP